eukprot:6550754-Ditylum_brightwellii.AAC.1
MLAALDDIYAKAPKDATIISGEDINAKLGRNIWLENEDSTSPHPTTKSLAPSVHTFTTMPVPAPSPRNLLRMT